MGNLGWQEWSEFADTTLEANGAREINKGVVVYMKQNPPERGGLILGINVVEAKYLIETQLT